MKVFFGDKNVGDTLSPIILEHFTNHKIERASAEENGKLVMVGSFLDVVKSDDTILGVGSNKPDFHLLNKNIRVMSVRGPLTNAQLPDLVKTYDYGDPAILLPLIYNPSVQKTRSVGYIPHYIDWPLFEGKDYIDISQPWRSLVDEILSCDMIISSSLHGLVIAQAYNIPAIWHIYSNKIAGSTFKFLDYFLGVGLGEQVPGLLPPITDLAAKQEEMILLMRQL